MTNWLGAINQAKPAPNVTGITRLTADSNMRTLDTELPTRTTINEAIDQNCNVTESKVTVKMQ